MKKYKIFCAKINRETEPFWWYNSYIGEKCNIIEIETDFKQKIYYVLYEEKFKKTGSIYIPHNDLLNFENSEKLKNIKVCGQIYNANFIKLERKEKLKRILK